MLYRKEDVQFRKLICEYEKLAPHLTPDQHLLLLNMAQSYLASYEELYFRESPSFDAVIAGLEVGIEGESQTEIEHSA